MRKLFILPLLVISVSSFGQKSSSTFTKEDSLAIINELKEELKLLFGEKKESFGDVSAGVGNGFFRPTTSNKATVENKTIYNLNGSYYHKSGLGIDLRNLFINTGSGLQFFQAALTPSYTYTRNKAFAAGASYTRYLYGKDLPFATSPLVNEWQVFGRLKKVLLQPGVTLNYAHGTYSEDVPAESTTPAYTYTEDAQDFGIMASIRHSFTFLDVFTTDDGFRITPSLMTIAGTSKYGMNFAVGSVSNSFTRFNVKPKKQVKKAAAAIGNGLGIGNGNGNGNNGNNNGNTGSGSTEAEEYNETYSTGFKFQSATFVLGTEYSWKQFYIQPQWLIDYALQPTDNRWTNVFNISVGITL